MKRKNFLALFISAVMAFSTLAVTGCAKPIGGGHEDEIVVKVWNYDGGVGNSWLDQNVIGSAADRFMKENEGREFPNGKTGVYIDVYADKNDPLNTITTSEYSVFFLEGLAYNNLANGIALDIDDVVTGTNKYESGKTIASKMNSDVQSALTAYDGHYHVIPHYQSYDSLTYNKTLFDDNNFYFAAKASDYANSNASDPAYGFIKNSSCEKTVGPDGVKNTSDDGLPSSIDELICLCEYVKAKSKTPFIWYNGFNKAYQQKLTNALWAAMEGYDGAMTQFTFKSKANTTTRIITNLNDDGTYETEDVAINENNAYLVYQQESRYHALRFCEYLFSNANKFHEDATGSASHTDVQKDFMKDDVAMLIEGTYWQNEATDALTFVDYPDLKDVEVAYMPLPVQGTGSVTEGNGKKPVLIDTHSSFAFINANTATKHDQYVLQVAKEFLQFCYTDESLANFTVDSSVTRGLDYSLGDRVDELSDYAKSVWNAKENGKVVVPISGHNLYVKNPSTFSMYSASLLWKTSAGIGYSRPWGGFRDGGLSAKAYFLGMKKDSSWWNGLSK